MVSLEELKDFMRRKAEEDREIRSVQVGGETLEAALKEASIELGIPVARLEFETLQKGSQGLFGFGKRPWSLIVYEGRKAAPKAVETGMEGFELPDQETSAPEDLDRDGQSFVRLWHDGVYVKVIPPRGQGEPVLEEDVLAQMHERGVRDINKTQLKAVVKLAEDRYAKVGDYLHNPAADPLIAVETDDQEMRATIYVDPPNPGGADLAREDIEHFLRNQGVVHGLQDKAILDFIDQPQYRTKYVVAEGTKPVHGKDARIVYFFETSAKVKPKEVDGRVDFKNLNHIHNVVKGEDLARKEPAERGQNGRTVTGRILPAKDGKDLPWDLGNNVQVSKDGLRVQSTADGQVMVSAGKISVETVLDIPGDVNLSTGNVSVYGSVVVHGSVDDGFTVKAAGNIEVMGTVGKCILETPGDIIVHQGIKGGGSGVVKAGQNLWSKFVENSTVEVGNFVVVSDGIVNCQMTALRKILCKGRRAKIMGGHLRAGEVINASSLGSAGSGETILEVGFDPKSKEELEALKIEKTQIETLQADRLLNIQGLLKQKRIRQKLLPDKEAQLKELQKQAKEADERLAELNQDIEKKLKHLEGLKMTGKISASMQVYPGVKVIIKDVELDVTRDYNAVTFVRDGNVVRPVKYEEIDEEELARRT